MPLNQGLYILIKIPKVIGDEDSHVFHQYTISLNFKKRDELAKYFTSNNIPYGIYYPIPLHKQKAYQNDRFNDEDFKNTNKLCNSVISLPMHTELNDDQINFICNKIITFLK